MPKTRKKVLVVIIAVVVIVAVAVAAYFAFAPPAPTGPKPVGKVSWSIGTCTPGSVGYIVHSATVDLLMRKYPDYFDLSVKAAGCAAASLAAWDKGECDLGYVGMTLVYQYITKTGRWAPTKAKAMKYDEMTVIVWQYPLLLTLFVTEDLKDKVTCWSDLKKLGTSVGTYPTPAGHGGNEIFREVFSTLFDCAPEDLDKILALDVSDLSAVGDLLITGKVKVIWGYGDPAGPASWVTDAFSRYGYKLVAVPPSPSELQKLLSKCPDLVKYTLDLTPYNVKTRDGKTSFDTIAVAYGLVGSKKLSKDHIYLLFEAHVKYASDFEATGLSTFKNYKNWFLPFNVESFKKQSTFGAKIHPGVAECLKNYGYDPKSLGILVAEG